ncbi:fatty acyl-AMP ligase [Amycolatopsis pigmentata]|uniref:Fatty acyl-AMP ligase n=1 Tax=Amycolatopsis pigmentata TaxID=450801 RepID=A0ABW5FQD1_9PSEU
MIPDVLAEHAIRIPDRTAYVFLNEDGEETVSITYRELYARALAVAGELSRRCAPGDRAMLAFPQNLDFIVGFFGCLYAQVVAVPVNPPRRSRVQDATRGIAEDCEAAAVLTSAAMVEKLRSALDYPGGPSHWLAVDEMVEDETGFEPPVSSAETLAFLQYTSGSTAAPKGVMVSHGNLAANEEMIRYAFGHDEKSTVVGWAPFFHDQGLIGNVLQPLYVGAKSILMSPAAFIRRPLLWLRTISRYRAHTSGGPNFAFDACVEHAAKSGIPELDLSCWKVAFNGAEPIRPETLRRFAETFAPSGFDEGTLYPCYGLAEATLIVTGSRKGRGPRIAEVDAGELGRRRFAEVPGGRPLVGSGLVLPGEEVRIVDPDTRRSCPDDRIGEIWVSGPHVAQGYWKRPDTTAETLRAICDGDSGRTYLRTGDLGVLADSELFVVGRLKDLLIIRGRNHYPQDIEQTVQEAHPALRPGCGAAFTVAGENGEKLVVVQEIRREHRMEADPLDVSGAIRAAVLAEHELAIGELVLTMPGRLPKTSSGKIMRAAARKRYLDGEFEPWTRPHREEGAVQP